MLTDYFFQRYQSKPVKTEWSELDRRFMFQATTLLKRAVLSKPEYTQNGQDMYDDQQRLETTFETAHRLLADELGLKWLSEPVYFYNGKQGQKAFVTICDEFLNAKFDERTGPFVTIGLRLSLIELLLRHHEQFVKKFNEGYSERLQAANDLDGKVTGFSFINATRNVEANSQRINDHFRDAVVELNERLRLAGYPINYHNGFFQFTDDDLTTDAIHEPFWSLVADPMWANVDTQMKEAIDRRDKADRTAAFHAVSALESVVKIISGTKGWDTGHEKGAANYVDNLASKKNGNFMEQWEAELLKKMFTDVRNPFAHGPGRDAMPSLSPQLSNGVQKGPPIGVEEGPPFQII